MNQYPCAFSTNNMEKSINLQCKELNEYETNDYSTGDETTFSLVRRMLGLHRLYGSNICRSSSGFT